ncbi:MAG TPA: hypothetical protein VK936_00735 [Longimicrobiales bacterium]|nr:hypothetical protein [Longimicrobiales bacterium]
MARRGVQAPRFAALTALAFACVGCAGILGSYAIAPNGLSVEEDRLRQMLARGQAAAALERLDRTAPGDDVLRALYHGIVAYHAGRFEESARILDIAGDLADERITKSISRSALSLVSNDLVLPYEPGRTERLMIPYVAALARIRLGDVPGAAVEARRLSLLLQQYVDRDSPPEPGLHAALRLFAGTIFEAAGETNDASVAYRNAQALDPLATVPGGLPAETGTGSVVVVLEQGFVAHRTEQALAVLLLPEEVHAIAHGPTDDRAAVTAFVAGRVLAHAVHGEGIRRGMALYVPAPDTSVVPARRGRAVCAATVVPSAAGDPAGSQPRPASHRSTEECTEKDDDADELPYLLKVAWPAYRSDHRIGQARLLAGSDTVPFAGTGDLSAGVMADYESERALVVARTIARGAAKLALTKGAERSVEDRSEVAGRLIGLAGNIGSVLLERADTRSWHLLPAGIALARVTLPAGEHMLEIAVGYDEPYRSISAGSVAVRPGQLTILPVRVW